MDVAAVHAALFRSGRGATMQSAIESRSENQAADGKTENRRQPLGRRKAGAAARPATAEMLEPRRLLTAFTVISTNDAGPGSLRQAILDANANAGADTIGFAIPRAGVQTISLLSAVTITDTVSIDGYTQPGASRNTQVIGNDANLLIDVQVDHNFQGSNRPSLPWQPGQITRRLVAWHSEIHPIMLQRMHSICKVTATRSPAIISV